jgi:hypothetical protein
LTSDENHPLAGTTNDRPPPDTDALHTEAARRCLALWRRPNPTLEVQAKLEPKFRVAYPMIAHALNHVANALSIMDKAPLVAASSARVAIEHALTAQWILLTRDGERVVANNMKHSWMTRSQRFADATGTHDELKPILDRDPIPESERSFTNQMVFDRFDDTGRFYDLYRDLTQAIHPSYGTITAHIRIEEGGDNSLGHLSPDGNEHRIGSLATGLGVAAVLALDAFERLRAGSPHLLDVEEIANTAGLPHDLRYSDQQPALEPEQQDSEHSP